MDPVKHPTPQRQPHANGQPATGNAFADSKTRVYDTPTKHTAQIEPSNNNNGFKAENNGWFNQIKGFFSLLAFIGSVLIAAFLINQFVFQSYFVEGTSMVPTLQNNDRLIIEKVGKTWSHIQGKPYIPNRGDIVVLDSSIIGPNGSAEQLIKRVIGLPGETVRIAGGTVTVTNSDEPTGFDVDERLGLDLELTYAPSPQEYRVPEGKVFVMGDNRTQNGSHDSRALGAIDSKNIEGRLWARILPIDQAQLFPTPDPN